MAVILKDRLQLRVRYVQSLLFTIWSEMAGRLVARLRLIPKSGCRERMLWQRVETLMTCV